MRYQVEKQGADVIVRIDDVAGRERALIDAIHLCRQSAWACQSGECCNIGAIEEHVEGGSVVLKLIPRSGVEVNPRGIEICLRYTLASG